MLQVTFSQDGAPLVIGSAPPETSGLWLPEDGVGQVVRELRKTRAPSSAYVRAPLLAAFDDITDVTLTIYAKAESSAALQALRAQVDAAANQWAYDLTVTVDEVATTYPAEIALPAWQAPDSGMVRAHIDFCRLVIPVNP